MSRHIDGGYGERADDGRQPGQTGPAAAVFRRSHAIAGYLGRSDQFDRSIAAFSQRYAEQNELDYQAFAKAIRSDGWKGSKASEEPSSDHDKGGIVGNAASNGPVQLNRRLIAGGGVLIGIGGLLGFTGMVLVSSAIVSAARQRVNQLEQPPNELAKRKWQQARAATTAGAKAWRNSPAAKVSS